MIEIDKTSKIPIYLQVETALYDQIQGGQIAPGEMIPSVRKVARENGVNPNTIQKAYAELIEQGVLYSVAGIGNYVSQDALKIKTAEKETILKDLARMAQKAKAAGIWMDEVFETVDSAYSR